MPPGRATRQTLSISDLAIMLGIDRSSAYELAKHDRLPVPVFRVGRRLLVSRRAVDQLLRAHRIPSPAGEGVGDQPT
ncbi:MAG: helix-turn-helix domain-containing protein [Chloroflexota bacterium]|nr:helix-turn-helix domain-containing protein [Chloroflexota bacterium]